jgi:hypothetical protein
VKRSSSVGSVMTVELDIAALRAAADGVPAT